MAEVKKLCEDFWAWRMRDSPEFATYCGNHDYDDKLDDVTTEAYDRRQVSASRYLCTPDINPSVTIQASNLIILAISQI